MIIEVTLVLVENRDQLYTTAMMFVSPFIVLLFIAMNVQITSADICLVMYNNVKWQI